MMELSLKTLTCLAMIWLAGAARTPFGDVYEDQTVCSNEGIASEIVLVVDRSFSISRQHFKLLQSFTKSLASHLLGLSSDARMAIVSYAQTTTVDCYLTSSTRAVHAYLDSMSNSHNGGLTRTMDALREARSVLRGRRQNVPVYVILFTDGVSNDGSSDATAKTIAEAAILKKIPNITLIAVGIGSDVNRDELNGVATRGAENVFTVDSFSQLDKKLIDSIMKKTCVLPANPCEKNKRYGDVIFVPMTQHFSPFNGQLVLKMAETFAASTLIATGNHVRVGVVPQRCQLDVGYSLDTPLADLPDITKSKLSNSFFTSVDYLTDLKSSYKPRPDGMHVNAKIAVLVVDRNLSWRQSQDVSRMAGELRRSGITLVVIGVGSSYDRDLANDMVSPSRGVNGAPRLLFSVEDYLHLFDKSSGGSLELNGAHFSHVFETLRNEVCVPKRSGFN